MTPETIEQLALRFQSGGLSELEFTQGESSLRLVAGSAALSEDTPVRPPHTSAAKVIRAQFAGRFRPCHPLGGEPMAAQGSAVRPGQVVGLLQIGPIVRPVTATEAGILGRALVADGDLAGFGEPLFDLVDNARQTP